MSDLRVAIIGCGKQAEKHISGLRAAGGVEIVLADIDEGRARSLARRTGLEWLPSVDRAIADAGIRAVDICTPTPSHALLLSAAVDAGKDVFCEKPLAATVGEARSVAERVERAGCVGMVGYVYRFAPAFEWAKRLLDRAPAEGTGGALGRIVTAVFRIGGRGSHQEWKHRRETGGGAVNEMLVHMVDLAIWYFGGVRDVEVLACDLLRPVREIGGRKVAVDAEDFVMVRLTMESGVQVFCQADLVTPAFMQSAEIQGENGTFCGSIQPLFPSFLYLEQAAGGFSAGRTGLEFGELNLFEAQMGEFLRAVRDRSAPTRSTVRDSVALMEVIDRIKSEAGL